MSKQQFYKHLSTYNRDEELIFNPSIGEFLGAIGALVIIGVLVGLFQMF